MTTDQQLVTLHTFAGGIDVAEVCRTLQDLAYTTHSTHAAMFNNVLLLAYSYGYDNLLFQEYHKVSARGGTAHSAPFHQREKVREYTSIG